MEERIANEKKLLVPGKRC